MASGFFDALLLQNEGRLGTAVLAGKLNLLTNQPANQDLLDTFTLFGDPATQFNTDLWTGLQTFLPITTR
ncbi:MAG: hypothetical protein GY805_14560 [Chloroflexi bacterium]|nr:hypothetical protein [Chloroflexota bacterium]